jgi:large subunit ribosomal protein L25
MTNVITLEAIKRETAGKGAARADRKAGRLPIVIYGNKQPSISLTVSFNEVLRLLNKGGFKHSEFNIQAGNENYKATFKAIQLHPVLNQPIHIDFLRVA